jgi:hypothetical protein
MNASTQRLGRTKKVSCRDWKMEPLKTQSMAPIHAVIVFLFIACFGYLSGPLAADPPAATEATGSKPDLWVHYPGTNGPGQGKHVVLISGDEEYRSEEALTQLGKILAIHHGFNCTVLFAIEPKTGIIHPNYPANIPGLAALRSADLMVIATRFRDLPDDQMQEIDDYLRSGRPVLGMRTATHAFRISVERRGWLHYDYRYNAPANWVHHDPKYDGDQQGWTGGFGGTVLGDTWFYHHGHHNHQSTRGLTAPEASKLPLTRGLHDGDIWGLTDVYAVRLPLPGDSKQVILGQTMDRKGPYLEDDLFLGMRPTDDLMAGIGHNPTADRGEDRYNPNDPPPPVAWTKTYQIPIGQKGKVFATTMGSATDLVSAGTRRLLVNAAYWCVGLETEIPVAGTKVELVGDYRPTAYRFHGNDYWESKALKPAAFQNMD